MIIYDFGNLKIRVISCNKFLFNLISNQQIYLMFGRQQNDRPSKFEKAYDEQGCQQMIKYALDDMQQFADEFSYTTHHPFIGHKKQYRRNSVYLRFNCPVCSKGEKKKRFTSTMGTVSIWFQLQKQGPEQYYPFKLVFRLQIYRMRCLSCRRYGEAEIYDSQLLKIETAFCKMIANILNGVPPPSRKRNKKPMRIPDLKYHKHEECEACQLVKCHPPTSICPKKLDLLGDLEDQESSDSD